MLLIEGERKKLREKKWLYPLGRDITTSALDPTQRRFPTTGNIKYQEGLNLVKSHREMHYLFPRADQEVWPIVWDDKLCFRGCLLNVQDLEAGIKASRSKPVQRHGSMLALSLCQ
jgi:hypothetical protein